jgi:bifunctional N-acetylglucosamine-1-phosphate-uridyltransferase/glucosamine-1-phosphate-acetyltransferase GlmU-like protein
LLYADVPLLQPSTLTALIEHHRTHKAAATVLTMELPDPYGYGRHRPRQERPHQPHSSKSATLRATITRSRK